jgi:N-acyl-D-amino-acid deacylase
MWQIVAVLAAVALAGCGAPGPEYDYVLRGGTVYDGTGAPGFVADLAIQGDRIVKIGDVSGTSAKNEIDVSGLAVAPGFINMMSWSNESLIEDGTAQSDIRQGVTLEVLGEGTSMGPLTPEMKRRMQEGQGDIRYDVVWDTLGEYLDYLEKKGVAPNVCSYIGAATPRVAVIGHEDRPASAEELDRMRAMVRQAMEEGAMGVASSLVYPPGFFASTEELVELAKVAAEYDGVYASHIRSEGESLVEAVEELLRIVRESGARGELYHLKAAGRSNWGKLDEVIELIEQARREGVKITADAYTYTAGSAGLTSTMPPWVQEGGFEKALERMRDTATRARIKKEMNVAAKDWENMYVQAGGPKGVLLVGFKTEKLKPLTGKTLAEAAKIRGESPEDAAMNLILEDGGRVNTVYFTQSEDNLRKKVQLPWLSFCSDSPAMAPAGVFLKSSVHPRAYGSFARVLGKLTRDEGLMTLEEAVRKLAGLPAQTLGLKDRGLLKEGYFADVAVFDPARIEDHATYESPHQYATGMAHVFVNGGHTLADGEPTGVMAGRFVKGPGAR